MKIAIIDSGLGGLSVCASLAHHLEHSSLPLRTEIKYINAVPEDDLGYNQMKTRDLKIQTFNRALYGIHRWYHPDFIFVACNSLSVLIEETLFYRQELLPIAGMIEIGSSLLLHHLASSPSSGVLLFAAETTIKEDIYAKELKKNGIAAHRIVSQSLPGLATQISNDLPGAAVFEKIRFYTEAVMAAESPFAPDFAFLGCTHYAYRQAMFEQVFADLGFPRMTILNPNEEAAQTIFRKVSKEKGQSSDHPYLSVEFVSRYSLPLREIETLSHFLSHSPPTVAALKNYTLKPDLFDFDSGEVCSE
ncbi:MAG: aspartate/glutamate racemase family protein [SAR324 cluster bacterium]|nr:aspartate/glutamate racemase family protein [SAR324 cluster bacterium]